MRSIFILWCVFGVYTAYSAKKYLIFVDVSHRKSADLKKELVDFCAQLTDGRSWGGSIHGPTAISDWSSCDVYDEKSYICHYTGREKNPLDTLAKLARPHGCPILLNKKKRAVGKRTKKEPPWVPRYDTIW